MINVQYFKLRYSYLLLLLKHRGNFVLEMNACDRQENSQDTLIKTSLKKLVGFDLTSKEATG